MSQEGERDDTGTLDATPTESSTAESSVADATTTSESAAVDEPSPVETEGAERPAVVEQDAVYGAFVDATPRTVPDLTDATGLDEDAVHRALDALEDADDLESTTLTDGTATVVAWYLPASAHVERLVAGNPDADRSDAVEEAIADLEVPGVSEMMQDWRRDAVRGAWEYLAEQGVATDDAIVDAAFSSQNAGYDDPEDWWACVRPRLRSLPGVAAPEDGTDDVWTYAPA